MNEVVNEEHVECDEQDEYDEYERFSIVGLLYEIIQTAVSMFIIVLVLRVFLINAYIPSGSMEPQISVGDKLIGSKISYWCKDPERFDVVMFEYPLDHSLLYIKRVIGLPGDSIDITDGKIYVNGSTKPLDEDYLAEDWVVLNDDIHYDVPADCYLVLGDNRNFSEDARYWQDNAIEEGLDDGRDYTFVKRDEIKAKAILRYSPIPGIIE